MLRLPVFQNRLLTFMGAINALEFYGGRWALSSMTIGVRKRVQDLFLLAGRWTLKSLLTDLFIDTARILDYKCT